MYTHSVDTGYRTVNPVVEPAGISAEPLRKPKESLDKRGLSGGSEKKEWFWLQIASEAISL